MYLLLHHSSNPSTPTILSIQFTELPHSTAHTLACLSLQIHPIYPHCLLHALQNIHFMTHLLFTPYANIFFSLFLIPVWKAILHAILSFKKRGRKASVQWYEKCYTSKMCLIRAKGIRAIKGKKTVYAAFLWSILYRAYSSSYGIHLH